MSGPQPTSVAPAPEFVPVALLSLTLGEANVVFRNKEYAKGIDYIEVKDGSITTVKNDLGLEFEVKDIIGNDKVTHDLVTGTTILDVNLFGKTANGSGVHITYPGIARISDKVAGVLGGKGTFSDFDEYIHITPTFRFCSTAEEKFKWAASTYFTGKGRFLRDDAGFYVQYYLYAAK